MSVLLLSMLLFSAALALYVVLRSIVVIGPTEVGLVIKRVSRRHNTTDTPIAFSGEAGYQAELLMPGVRFKLWPTYAVIRYPWVQVPARKAEADGEAAFVRVTGEAERSRRRAIGLGDAAAVEAFGLAKAKGYEAQVRSLGSTPTAAVAIANALSEGKLDVVPDVPVTGGGGALDGLAATFMRSLNGKGDGSDKPKEEGRDPALV